jgi:glycerophosphoryl diester phosphodiesterase
LRPGRYPKAEQATCRGAKVPTLEEALVFTRDADWKLNLELKFLPAPMADFPVVPRVLALIDRVGLPLDRFLISSFNHVWLEEVKERRPA